VGGKFITATATDPAGNTSEFSQCKQAPFVSTFQFGTPSVTTVEDCDEVVFTVSRIGDTSTAASVEYATQSGTASDRTDFTATRGTLQFAPGETAMAISVLISEDSFTEGTETARSRSRTIRVRDLAVLQRRLCRFWTTRRNLRLTPTIWRRSSSVSTIMTFSTGSTM
jgi:hypothetical protein